MCLCVLITDILPFFLSLSHAGLQLRPSCHGDSAQHWSGYFVHPLFYLRKALLSESAYLCSNYKFMWVFIKNLLLPRVPGKRTAVFLNKMLKVVAAQADSEMSPGPQGDNLIQNLGSNKLDKFTHKLKRSGLTSWNYSKMSASTVCRQD